MVSGEYAWGSTSITEATSITNDGTVSERGQAGSNITYNNTGAVQGPTRVGSYGSGAMTRPAAGAGYYGAMDLSGNVWEMLVTVGESTGRLFDGNINGDGVLDTSGNGNQNTWPPPAATGAGLRGGSFENTSLYTSTSSRYLVTNVPSSRLASSGGHGVRSAGP